MAQVIAGLIGDVVGSRQVPDRAALQHSLLEVLESVSERSGVRLAVTLGDEFQGRFSQISQAVASSWWLHLHMIGVGSLRIGIGWGEILVEAADDSPFGQDGPAWWRAREAIEAVDLSHPARTVVVTGTEWDDFVNDYLALRDSYLGDLDETDAVILAGLEAGETQRALAERLGLHESSVSRRVSRRNLTLLHRMGHARLPAIPHA